MKVVYALAYSDGFGNMILVSREKCYLDIQAAEEALSKYQQAGDCDFIEIIDLYIQDS